MQLNPKLTIWQSLSNIPNYPNLQELRLDWDPPIYRKWLFFPPPPPDFEAEEGEQEETVQLPPLRRLELNGLTISSNFCSILPDTLTYLSLRGGSVFEAPYFDRAQKLEKLTTLIMEDAPWVKTATVNALVCDTQAPLRVLHIDECFNFTTDDFKLLFQYMKVRNPDAFEMTELSIVQLQGSDDEFIKVICAQLKKLKILNLSKTSITGCTIRDLADSKLSGSSDIANLDRLYVRGCERVSSDAITYGRERGLEIIT